LINHIKTYEAAKPKQHLVWKTAMDDLAQGQFVNALLFNSPADAISPNHRSVGDYRTNPPAATGQKVILSDTDHLWGVGGDVPWVWKTFVRGNHPIFMDPRYGGPWLDAPVDLPEYEAIRNAMGQTVRYSHRMNLAATLPQAGGTSNPSSTGYCLYEAGVQYLVYQPGNGPFTVNPIPEDYRVEWIDPDTGERTSTGSQEIAGPTQFAPPFGGHSVLFLDRAGVSAVQVE
jgi:hypothetical protein